jgi:chemotaxis family two-component system response regulator Rcp1
MAGYMGTHAVLKEKYVMVSTIPRASPMAVPGERRMSATPTNRTIEILLVEDSPDDADLMTEALREGRLEVKIHRVGNGEEAMAFLYRQGPFTASPRPDLILLDLHLPRMNGHEVLAELKRDAAFRRIPIVIITSSENEQDIVRAYDLYANCCVCKPADQEQFALAVQKIEQFWLQQACRR